MLVFENSAIELAVVLVWPDDSRAGQLGPGNRWALLGMMVKHKLTLTGGQKDSGGGSLS
jgi:hypothetical protein